ncbi:MAG: MobC family plasmid mobilization relaxosome protein [Ruminococcaceae bacterium]|nr:MobC family plasmid mobilization relaxosome protein [Oscillospiraceae bacterium]
MNKDTVFSIRISSENLDEIRRRAKLAHLSQSDYVVRCCLGKPVVVIEALKEFLDGLRAIGHNLNQLTKLANIGHISIVYLDEFERALAQLGEAVSEAVARGK